jgi:hypothetical protein
MNQLHSRKDRSGGHGGIRSGIPRQDLMRKAGHLASGHRPKADGVLTRATARSHRRRPGKRISWTGRERLRVLWYRLRLTAQEMNTTGRTLRPTATSTGPATASRADVKTPRDPGYDQTPRPVSQPC